MHRYLSRDYDTGDGPLFTKTPLELCAKLRADGAAELVRRALGEYSRARTSSTLRDGGQRERVELAKERLRAFQRDSKRS